MDEPQFRASDTPKELSSNTLTPTVALFCSGVTLEKESIFRNFPNLSK